MKTLPKSLLIAAFSAVVLAGCGVRDEKKEFTTDKTIDAVASRTMGVFNEYDRYIDRYVDVKTEQFCMGKTGSDSTLVCQDFNTLSDGGKKYVERAKVFLQNAGEKLADGTSARQSDARSISVNINSLVINDVGRGFERYVDFAAEKLCITKTSGASGLSCKEFSGLNDAQRAYVAQMHGQLDKARQPKQGQ